MAKPFYSQDEVCERLKRDADGVKALVREGKLREFRDAGKVFYKADEVDKLAGGGAKSDTGELMLESAEDELPSLADVGGGTSVIGLQPSSDDEQKAKKEGTVISASGIGVFDDEELEIDADPLAKTQITTATTPDQLSLEGTGGGSGLLDLTRESDDTSLGAELLDEIFPGDEQPAEPRKAAAPAARTEEPEPEPEPAAAPEPMYEPVAPVIVGGDPNEGVFAGLLVGILILLAVSGSVVAGAIQGFVPSYARFFSDNFWFFLGGATLVPLLALLVGWVIGRSSSAPARPRRAAA